MAAMVQYRSDSGLGTAVPLAIGGGAESAGSAQAESMYCDSPRLGFRSCCCRTWVLLLGCFYLGKNSGVVELPAEIAATERVRSNYLDAGPVRRQFSLAADALDYESAAELPGLDLAQAAEPGGK